MRCPGCGKKNPDTRRFCQECGKDLEKVRLRAQNVEYVCPSCGTKGTKADKFCGSCGAEMPILLPWLDEEEEARMRDKIAEYRNLLELMEGSGDILCYEDRYESLNAEISSLKINLNDYITSFRRRWSRAAGRIRSERRESKNVRAETSEGRSRAMQLTLFFVAVLSIPLVAAVAGVLVYALLPAAASRWITLALTILAYGGICTVLHAYAVPDLSLINMIVVATGAIVGIVFTFISPLRIVALMIFGAAAAGTFMLFLLERDKDGKRSAFNLGIALISLLLASSVFNIYALASLGYPTLIDFVLPMVFLGLCILCVVIGFSRDEARWWVIAYPYVVATFAICLTFVQTAEIMGVMAFILMVAGPIVLGIVAGIDCIDF